MKKINNSATKKRTLKYVKVLLSGLLSLYVLIWFFSPVVFRYFINNYLQENYAIEMSSNSGIRYNPFTSHLTVRDLELLK
ncbi:MAG: hypothetical protein L3J46_06055, partial [Kangiellaceae bacterium]|nr:hypothetical protein [Kangiellaceae bacterium]